MQFHANLWFENLVSLSRMSLEHFSGPDSQLKVPNNIWQFFPGLPEMHSPACEVGSFPSLLPQTDSTYFGYYFSKP